MRVSSNIKLIFYLFILLIYVQPEYFITISLIHITLTILRMVFLLIGIVTLIQRKIVPILTIYTMIFYFITIVSTYLNNGEIFAGLLNRIPIIGFILWLEIIVFCTPKLALKSLAIYYSIITVINLLLYILFPQGYSQYISTNGLLVTRHFIGVENQFAYILFPTVIFCILYSKLKYNRISIITYLITFLVIFSLIISKSGTAIFGITLMILYLFFADKKLISNYLTPRFLLITYTIIFILLILFNYSELFSFIIVNFLRRDLTLSTRVTIWNESINMIKDSILLGYGIVEGGLYLTFRNVVGRNSHNMLLQLLLKSGIIGIIPLMFMFKHSFNKLQVYGRNHISKFLTFMTFIVGVIMLAEVYPMTLLLSVLFVINYLPEIAFDIQTEED